MPLKRAQHIVRCSPAQNGLIVFKSISEAKKKQANKQRKLKGTHRTKWKYSICLCVRKYIVIGQFRCVVLRI